MAKHNESNNGDPEAADLHEHPEDKGTGATPSKGAASRTQPQHLRGMEAPDAQALVTGVCGETMGIYLRLNGNTIREATFLSDGCTPAVAYANLLTTMVQGMSLTEARRIKPQDLILELRRLLDGHDHCAKLAVNTLHHALAAGRTHDKASRKG